MADRDLLNNLTNGLKDQLEDKVNPGKVFSESNLKKKRSAFWICFLAALLLVLLSLAGSIAYNVTSVSLLKEGVDRTVVASGLISQSDADAFVYDTLDYLTGVKTVWEPAITVGDHRIGVPEAFKTHMATVKGWVESAKAVLLAGAAIVLLLLGRALIGTKGSGRSRFSVGGYYLGAAVPLVLIAGVGLWGMLDFEGLWGWIHQTLIPDGIFGAGEEIMKLFPVELFAGYLQPVGLTFAICVAAVLVLPLVLIPLGKLLTALFGAKGTSGRGGSSRKTTSARKTSTRKSTRKVAD